jgi:hypothetical protein
MKTKLAIATFCAALGLLAASAPASASTAPPSNPVESLASSILAKLVAGDVTAVTAGLHEPPNWDKARAADDRRQGAEQLGPLLEDFGKISSPKVAKDVTFFHIQLAGGDMAYWQSLPNMGVEAKVVYRVKFAKAGPGVVTMDFIHASGTWELRGLGLGIEQERSDARETMRRLGGRFLGRLAPGKTHDEIEKALDQMFGPAPDRKG